MLIEDFKNTPIGELKSVANQIQEEKYISIDCIEYVKFLKES